MRTSIGISVALLAVACAFAATPVWAGLTVTPVGTGGDHAGYGPWQTGRGGEFTLRPGGWNPLPFYAGPAKNLWEQGTFQTFCLETSEHIYANTPHAVVFNTKAIKGGVGPLGDPISLGTAWLYHEFQKGDPEDLLGYDYSNTGVGRHTSAWDLQNAIWYLEDEPGGSLTGAYQSLLEAKFVSILNAKSDNNGTYPVAVLNLYATLNANGDPDLTKLRQDMLVCVPVPAAALLGLLGLGTAGLTLRRYV